MKRVGDELENRMVLSDRPLDGIYIENSYFSEEALERMEKREKELWDRMARQRRREHRE